jgi:hypothetical protein
MLTALQLNDPSLLHEASLLNGEWVQASSGKTFDVEGESSALAHKINKNKHADLFREPKILAQAKFLPPVLQTRSLMWTNT